MLAGLMPYQASSAGVATNIVPGPLRTPDAERRPSIASVDFRGSVIVLPRPVAIDIAVCSPVAVDTLEGGEGNDGPGFPGRADGSLDAGMCTMSWLAERFG